MGGVLGKKKHSKIAEGSEAAKKIAEREKKELWANTVDLSQLPQEGKDAFLKFTEDRKLREATLRVSFWLAGPDNSTLTTEIADYLTKFCNLPVVREQGPRINVFDILNRISSGNQRVSETPSTSSTNPAGASEEADQIDYAKVERILLAASEVETCIELIKKQIKPAVDEDYQFFRTELRRQLDEDNAVLKRERKKR